MPTLHNRVVIFYPMQTSGEVYTSLADRWGGLGDWVRGENDTLAGQLLQFGENKKQLCTYVFGLFPNHVQVNKILELGLAITIYIF